MAWFDRFFGRKSSPLDIIRELYGSLRMSKTGRTVTLDRALQLSAVFACARVIGNGMAQVPLKLMQLSKDGKTRLPAVEHPLYQLMFLKPNAWMTSFEFRQVMSWHLEIAGRFVAMKIAPAGVIRELIPLDPSRLRIEQLPDFTLAYYYRGADQVERQIPTAMIWHVRGPSWNAWDGLDWLRYAREALGLAMATEESQARLHANGVQTSGVLSVEGKLNDEQQQQLRKWIEREYAGVDNAHRVLVMDRAAKWIAQQMTGVDAQHLETRRHQVEEVCRSMGVMPIMVGYYDKAATYASSEQMFMAHRENCLSPRWQMYEQSMDVNLLTQKERDAGFYFDFVEEGMMRGSLKDTKDAITGYVNGGILTPNEGRALLDLNPDDDPASEELRIPVNVAQEPAETNDPSAEPKPPAGDKRAPATPAGSLAVHFAEGAIQVKTELHSPDVHVENNVATPGVKVDVAAPTVNVAQPDFKQQIDVNPEVKVDITKMTIEGMPTRKTTSETHRDSEGKIKGITHTESDA